MCVYSVIGDHYKGNDHGELGGQPWTVPISPYLPEMVPPMPLPAAAPASLPWTPETFKLLQEILTKVQELDTKLGMAQCEDPTKVEWIKSLEKRIEGLENKNGTRKTRKRNKGVSERKLLSE